MARRRFYLAGGTALALQIGHRRVTDLDWFTEAPLADPLLLAQELRAEGIAFVTGQVDRGTLLGVVSRIRVRFLEYRYPSLEPVGFQPEFGCALSSLADLACMKLSAVSQRGARKDFVDVYALGDCYQELPELLALYQRKYSVEDIAHVLYGLAYFDDAEKERMPAMLWKTDWRTIKSEIQHWLRRAAR